VNILAIDPAYTRLGFYAKSGSTDWEKYCTLTMAAKDRLGRIAEVYRETQRIVTHLADCGKIWFNLCVVEGYPFSRHSSSTTKLAEAGAAVRLALIHMDLSIVELQPSQWRAKFKKLPPKGTKAKDLHYLAVVRSWSGKQFGTTDEADAFMMALSCSQVWNKKCMMTDADYRTREQIKEIISRKLFKTPV